MSQLSSATVIKRKDLSGTLFCLWLKLDISFEFKPGQYCTIGLPDEKGKLIQRPYSIVSAPGEPYLELFIKVLPLPEGVLTPRLWKLKEGDRITIRLKASGRFTFESEYFNQVMVATSIGIAPYISIIRDYLDRNLSQNRFFVLQGVSYCYEFGYDLELWDLVQKKQNVQFTYLPTVSRPWKKDGTPEEKKRGLPNIFWRGQTGRVHQILEKHLKLWRLSPQDSIVYACGHPGMIERVKSRLIPRGWKVKEERFWKLK